MPVVWLDGEDFESACDIGFCQPGSLACETDEGDGVIDCGVLHGEVRAGNEAINAWDSGIFRNIS